MTVPSTPGASTGYPSPGDSGATSAANPTGAAPASTTATPTRSDTYTGKRYRTAETKASFKTSELWVYLAAVVGVIITCVTIDGGGGDDTFTAIDGTRYITWLTIGYMIARGLAKAGRSHYDDDRY
jgi:hypothetical protein